MLVEFLRSAAAPKKDVGVQQVLHDFFLDFLARRALPSKASRISSGSGASKSSGMVIWPRKTPSLRVVSSAGMGTRRATGTPRLEMVISSPAATRGGAGAAGRGGGARNFFPRPPTRGGFAGRG